MKNVTLVISLIINCLGLAVVTKHWSPIKSFINSQYETKAFMRPIPAPDKIGPAKAVLQEAVLAQRTEMETCYDEYLRREPKSSNGYIAVQWMIGSAGNVESPTISDSEIHDSDMQNCVLEKVSKMVFDPKRFAENTQFSYRFHFKAKAPGSITFE